MLVLFLYNLAEEDGLGRIPVAIVIIVHYLVGVLAEVNEVPMAGSKPHGRRAALQEHDDPAFVVADVSHRGIPKF